MKASIDIGTNTVLLLIAQTNNGVLDIIYEAERAPRLGQGVDKDKNISQEATNRVISALNEFKDLIAQESPDVNSVQVGATSAVRDAQNQEAFLQEIKQQTSFEVEILSGLQEAEYTFKGAQCRLNNDQLNPQRLVIDIGGGSTEIAVGTGTEIEDQYSFNMGSVRFTERYLTDDPPIKSQVDASRQAICTHLAEHTFDIKTDNSTMIGVAGTVSSLAYIDKGCSSYDSELLSGYTITKAKISDYIQKLSQRPTQYLIDKYPEVMRARADIFLTGLLILDECMSAFNFDEVITSTSGIRHGMLLDD